MKNIKKEWKKIGFFIIITICISVSCFKTTTPMNDYQVVGLLPIDTVHYGRVLFYNDQLIILYANIYSYADRIRRYALPGPGGTIPQFIEDQQIPLYPLGDRNYKQNDLYLFTVSNIGEMQVLNLSNNESFTLYFDASIFSMAFKDSFMYMVSDSGLMVWNVRDPKNPLKIFYESDTQQVRSALIDISDTLCVEFVYTNDQYIKLWNIKDPALPQIVSVVFSPSMVSYPRKIVFDDPYIYEFDSYWNIALYRFIINDSGNVSYQGNYYFYGISDFLVRGINLYVLENNIIKIRDAELYPYPVVTYEIPLPGNILSFNVRDGILYILCDPGGVFICKKVEAE